MNTFEAIKNRRSIKHYDPEHVIPEEDIKKLMEAVLLSPTSFNIQNWRMVCVTDKELQQKIREVSWNQAQVSEASMLVIFAADLKASEKDPGRYWRNAPQQVQDFLVPAIGKYYDGNEALQKDEAHRSCGIAAQTLMLAAKDMGFDTCPMVGFDYEKVGKLINLPEGHILSLFVVVGKSIKDAQTRGGQLPYDEVVKKNTF